MSQKKYTLNEVDIVYRPLKELATNPKVDCPEDAVILFRENWDEMKIGLQEQFKIMLLNRSNRVLGIADISKGGIHGTVVDPKLLFAIALKAAACSIILAHNHPSGNIQPSREDIKLTEKLIEAGKILDITVLDHIIFSGLDNSFYAMNHSPSEGCIFLDMPEP